MKEFMSVPLRPEGVSAVRRFAAGLSRAGEAPPITVASLDLDTAIAKVSYRVGDVTFTRECFATLSRTR